MATFLRLLWSVAVAALVIYFVPEPWCWIWIGIIIGGWAVVLLAIMRAEEIRNCWR